jgi:hypothetical protein
MTLLLPRRPIGAQGDLDSLLQDFSYLKSLERKNQGTSLSLSRSLSSLSLFRSFSLSSLQHTRTLKTLNVVLVRDYNVLL